MFKGYRLLYNFLFDSGSDEPISVIGIGEVVDEKVLNYKGYINTRPVVPQSLVLNAHWIYTNTHN